MKSQTADYFKSNDNEQDTTFVICVFVLNIIPCHKIENVATRVCVCIPHVISRNNQAELWIPIREHESKE